MKRTTIVLAAALVVAAAPRPAAAQSAVADGARVWASNCVRCHNARPSVERTDTEWLIIVNHMRARANLTKTDARSVAAFLQATNLREDVVPQLTEPDDAAPAEAESPVEEVREQHEPNGLGRILAAVGRIFTGLGSG